MKKAWKGIVKNELSGAVFLLLPGETQADGAAQALLRQVADLAACAAAIEPGYAAENAVGVQLDAGGESWKQEYVAEVQT